MNHSELKNEFSALDRSMIDVELGSISVCTSLAKEELTLAAEILQLSTMEAAASWVTLDSGALDVSPPQKLLEGRAEEAMSGARKTDQGAVWATSDLDDRSRSRCERIEDDATERNRAPV